jgi:putative endonuclease
MTSGEGEEGMEKTGYYVYILASDRNGTLYVGVTSDLVKRIWQHKNDVADGFTKEHGVHRLVYYEAHPDVNEASRREKRLKRWDRQWKLELIETGNPQWRDLYGEVCA